MPNSLRHHTFSLADYLAREVGQRDKHEYFDGQIWLMAGGSARHNAICANASAALVGALRGSGCRALGPDQRLSTPEGLYTYADASVVCGAPDLGPEQTLRNPAILVEVLSESTRDYDRGEKLTRYRSIASLRHVLLVEQRRPDVEHWFRAGAEWERVVRTALEDVLVLDPPGIRLLVGDLYAGALDLP